MPHFKFPVTRQSTCCCNPCGWLVDYTGQPTSYYLMLSGLPTLTAKCPVGVCCTGCCAQGCDPFCCFNGSLWGDWSGDLDLNGTYLLENCLAYAGQPGNPPCLDLNNCLSTSSRVWNGFFTVGFLNPQVVQDCFPAPPACCPAKTMWHCAWLYATLQMTLPPCEPSSSSTITAAWQLNIKPSYTVQPYCPGGYVSPCCPGGSGAFSTSNPPHGFEFVGSSGFTGAVTQPGHIGGIAPLPITWSVSPNSAGFFMAYHYSGCNGPGDNSQMLTIGTSNFELN